MAATGPDTTYRPGIYRVRGGNAQVIKSTATQTVFGNVQVATGGSITVAKGAQLTFGTGSKLVRAFVNATASVTLAAAKAGTHYLNKVVGNIYTLPAATAAGNGVAYRINTASGGHSATGGAVDFKLRPQSADKVYGIVAGATDSEVIHLLGTGSVVGDGLEVRCDGANWHVVGRTGAYSRAAAT